MREHICVHVIYLKFFRAAERVANFVKMRLRMDREPKD